MLTVPVEESYCRLSCVKPWNVVMLATVLYPSINSIKLVSLHLVREHDLAHIIPVYMAPLPRISSSPTQEFSVRLEYIEAAPI